MAATHLDLGMQCIKYLLCAVNFLFALTGVMVVSIGTTIYAIYNNFSSFLDSSYFSPATVLIVVGIIIVVIAFFGCCGALKESTCMVLMFAFSLTLLLFAEISASIASYFLQDNIVNLLNKNINYTMHQYNYNDEAKKAIDFLQAKLHCCGYNGPQDWNHILTNSSDSNTPVSCYNLNNPTTGNYSFMPIIQRGCYHDLTMIVNQSALYLVTGATMIVLIQLAGIMFAFTLGREIRKQKTKRERRRWQMRESLITGYEPLGKTDPLTTFPVIYMRNNDFKTPTQTS